MVKCIYTQTGNFKKNYIPLMQSSKRFNAAFLKKLPLQLLVLLVLFAGALFFFVYIIHDVLWEKEEAADEAVFDYLRANIINPRLTGFMKAVTWCASSTFMQIAYSLLALIYLLQKNFKRCIEIAVVGIGGFLINYCMKISFKRIRPPDPLIDRLENFSFPSGHATSSFIFYGLLVYLLWKSQLSLSLKYLLGAVLLCFALLIGFSRVYLRVHYPSDVVAGFCIGLAWLALVIWLMERVKKSAGEEMSKGRMVNQ